MVAYTYDGADNLTTITIREPLTLNRYNYCVGNPANYADPSGNNHISLDPAAVNYLIYMLTGNEDYHEAADRMWEIQAEQKYYDYSISLGLINGVTESVYDEMASVVNLCREINTPYNGPYENKKREISETNRKKFHTYLDEKALEVADKDFYYLGKCCGNGIVYGVDVYLSLHSLVKSGGALINGGGPVQVARLARVNGGYDTVVLVNSTALAGVAEGSLGAAAGISLSQGAWSNLQENLGKIDMDRLLGREGGTEKGNWNKGSFDSPEESLDWHFDKHGEDVGAKTREEYLRKAEEFARTAKKGSTKSPVYGEVEGVIRYKKNGKYIDLAPDGSIISFGKQ